MQLLLLAVLLFTSPAVATDGEGPIVSVDTRYKPDQLLTQRKKSGCDVGVSNRQLAMGTVSAAASLHARLHHCQKQGVGDCGVSMSKIPAYKISEWKKDPYWDRLYLSGQKYLESLWAFQLGRLESAAWGMDEALAAFLFPSQDVGSNMENVDLWQRALATPCSFWEQRLEISDMLMQAADMRVELGQSQQDIRWIEVAHNTLQVAWTLRKVENRTGALPHEYVPEVRASFSYMQFQSQALGSLAVDMLHTTSLDNLTSLLGLRQDNFTKCETMSECLKLFQENTDLPLKWDATAQRLRWDETESLSYIYNTILQANKDHEVLLIMLDQTVQLLQPFVLKQFGAPCIYMSAQNGCQEYASMYGAKKASKGIHFRLQNDQLVPVVLSQYKQMYDMKEDGCEHESESFTIVEGNVFVLLEYEAGTFAYVLPNAKGVQKVTLVGDNSIRFEEGSQIHRLRSEDTVVCTEPNHCQPIETWYRQTFPLNKKPPGFGVFSTVTVTFSLFDGSRQSEQVVLMGNQVLPVYNDFNYEYVGGVDVGGSEWGNKDSKGDCKVCPTKERGGGGGIVNKQIFDNNKQSRQQPVQWQPKSSQVDMRYEADRQMQQVLQHRNDGRLRDSPAMTLLVFTGFAFGVVCAYTGWLRRVWELLVSKMLNINMLSSSSRQQPKNADENINTQNARIEADLKLLLAKGDVARLPNVIAKAEENGVEGSILKQAKQFIQQKKKKEHKENVAKSRKKEKSKDASPPASKSIAQLLPTTKPPVEPQPQTSQELPEETVPDYSSFFGVRKKEEPQKEWQDVEKSNSKHHNKSSYKKDSSNQKVPTPLKSSNRSNNEMPHGAKQQEKSRDFFMSAFKEEASQPPFASPSKGVQLSSQTRQQRTAKLLYGKKIANQSSKHVQDEKPNLAPRSNIQNEVQQKSKPVTTTTRQKSAWKTTIHKVGNEFQVQSGELVDQRESKSTPIETLTLKQGPKEEEQFQSLFSRPLILPKENKQLSRTTSEPAPEKIPTEVQSPKISSNTASRSPSSILGDLQAIYNTPLVQQQPQQQQGQHSQQPFEINQVYQMLLANGLNEFQANQLLRALLEEQPQQQKQQIFAPLSSSSGTFPSSDQGSNYWHSTDLDIQRNNAQDTVVTSVASAVLGTSPQFGNSLDRSYTSTRPPLNLSSANNFDWLLGSTSNSVDPLDSASSQDQLGLYSNSTMNTLKMGLGRSNTYTRDGSRSGRYVNQSQEQVQQQQLLQHYLSDNSNYFIPHSFSGQQELYLRQLHATLSSGSGGVFSDQVANLPDEDDLIDGALLGQLGGK